MNEILRHFGFHDTIYGATTGSSKGWIKTAGKELPCYSPIDGTLIAKVIQAGEKDYDYIRDKAKAAFKKWRSVPAPKRGEVVREIGNALREYKKPLARLITLEMGKILPEAEGEVQEMIDIADFAVGLSRQLYGLTMHSERVEHRMYEQWHPLGIVGIITAFNFPAAVWSWNALIAGVCGDVNLLKPSSKTPLTAIAFHKILEPIVDKYNIDGVFNLIIGSGREVGEKMLNDPEVPLVSATGSTRVGRHVAECVSRRFGKTILELGGNNAIIIAEDADLQMAIRATLFGAVGTAGQRCTSTRRIIIQKSLKDAFLKSLIPAYKQVRIGNPLCADTLMGPVIDKGAVDAHLNAIEEAKKEGAKLLYGGEEYYPENCEGGNYLVPTIMEAKNDYKIVKEETFSPLLYIIEYDDIEQAIEINNDVPQGLSSAIFTKSINYMEKFLSCAGSDCGIANVNIGTSGAEIGGAFGGEKETGGGRESGSDSWKAYMRRQTNTINYGRDLPLAQGINFE